MSATTLVNGTGLDGTLPAVQPFDLRTSIRALRGFGACKGDQMMTDSTLTKAVSIEGQAILFQVDPAAAGGVDYRLDSDSPIGDRARDQVLDRIDNYLSLSDDLTEFYALADQDRPDYAGLVRSLYGLHQVRFLTLAEIGVWFVLTQRSPQNIALGAKRRIVEAHGRNVVRDGVTHWAFPELADLEQLTAEDWLPLVRNQRKAEYLTTLVHGLQDIGEDYLRNAPYHRASKALLAIRGVGEFTATAILLRGLGRMDHVPLEMPSFAEATAAVYGPGDHSAELRRRYGTHLGYWAYYLRTGLGSLTARMH